VAYVVAILGHRSGRWIHPTAPAGRSDRSRTRGPEAETLTVLRAPALSGSRGRAIPREVGRPSRAEREAPRGPIAAPRQRLVREDDTFPAKSPGAGPSQRRERSVVQPS
jgi:hypothetical protein